MADRSFRAGLRAFQKIHGGAPPPGLIADLAFLQNRDLDLSVRLASLLAFNALMITIGTHPISASPGAPLSLDAPSQPLETIACWISIVPFLVAAVMVLRALLIGEEFETEGSEDVDVLRRRLLGAFVVSIEAQARLLRHAVVATLAGGVLTILLWGWILGAKMSG